MQNYYFSMCFVLTITVFLSQSWQDRWTNHCTNSWAAHILECTWPKLGQLEPFLFSKNDANRSELGPFCENGEWRLRTAWNCESGCESFCHYRMKPVDREKQKEEKRSYKRFNTLDLDVPEIRFIPDPSNIPTFACESIKSLLLGVTLQILLNTSRVPKKGTGWQKVSAGSSLVSKHYSKDLSLGEEGTIILTWRK